MGLSCNVPYESKQQVASHREWHHFDAVQNGRWAKAMSVRRTRTFRIARLQARHGRGESFQIGRLRERVGIDRRERARDTRPMIFGTRSRDRPGTSRFLRYTARRPKGLLLFKTRARCSQCPCGVRNKQQGHGATLATRVRRSRAIPYLDCGLVVILLSR